MSSGRSDYDEWIHEMRTAIMAASIVRQSHDLLSRHCRMTDEQDMRNFVSIAYRLADLWQKTTLNNDKDDGE